MIKTIVLPNTPIMVDLLKLLKLNDYTIYPNHISLNTADSELGYNVMSYFDEDNQLIYGKTNEWNELKKHIYHTNNYTVKIR